jgi:purine-binding chemotaxis protein CheW
VSADDAVQRAVFGPGLAEEILRHRAESLAIEQVEQADQQRVGILLFALGEEWYGVRIAQVREIVNDYVVTRVPCVPGYILGVLNIRGEIVSVTDLRAMMGLGTWEPPSDDTPTPVIVVRDETICTALVVDSIGDIAEVAAEAIEPPLAISDRAQADFVNGTFYVAGRLVALVNLMRVLSPIVAG